MDTDGFNEIYVLLLHSEEFVFGFLYLVRRSAYIHERIPRIGWLLFDFSCTH